MKLVFDSEEDEVLVEVAIEEDEDGETGVAILIDNLETAETADVWISFADFEQIVNFVDFSKYVDRKDN